MHSLQDLPPSVLLLVAQFLAPRLLKHAFRPPGYRLAHRSLVAASSTCHVLRWTCFPLAIRIFRNHDRKPLCQADIGESANELEKRIEWLLGREDLWTYIRMVDIELFARGSCSLGKHLATLISRLPHLESCAIRLPTFHIFRDGLTADLRAAFSECRSVRTLCVDAHSAWLVPYFPNVRELLVWCWPKPGGCEDHGRADGWKVVLASLNAQAPNVQELEIGGLSIWDVNEMLPALANLLRNVQALRILHRSEPYGAIPILSALVPPTSQVVPISPSIRTMPLPPALQSSTQLVWEDSHTDPEYEGRYISGYPGSIKKIIYFGLQDECGSCYVPRAVDSVKWKDVGPVVVLASEDMKDR